MEHNADRGERLYASIRLFPERDNDYDVCTRIMSNARLRPVLCINAAIRCLVARLMPTERSGYAMVKALGVPIGGGGD